MSKIINKDCIFFDFDGTLVDTSKGIFESVNYALDKMNMPMPIEKDLRKYIGPPLEWSFENFNNMTRQDALKATGYFRELYREKGVNNHNIYDEVVLMLEELKQKNKRIAIATSKPEHFAVKILKSYDILKYFDVVSGATLDGKVSTKKDVLSRALKLMNPCDIERCVLIGDTVNDVKGAKEVGMDCIGVLYGFGCKEDFNSDNVIAIAESPLEVAELF